LYFFRRSGATSFLSSDAKNVCKQSQDSIDGSYVQGVDGRGNVVELAKGLWRTEKEWQNVEQVGFESDEEEEYCVQDPGPSRLDGEYGHYFREAEPDLD
jgi:hypothetical protein